MTEETVNNGADAAPVADDLRSTITAAIERQRSGNADSQPAAEPAATVADADPKPEPTEGRARDEHGRFAPAEKPQEAKDATAVQPKPDKPEEPDAAPAADPTPNRPPPGWSPKSKAAFDTLPAEVKADIAKRETEVNQGLAKLAEYKPIERFSEMAKQGGTTLEKALTAYTNMENVFRRDPIAGVEQVCKNLGIDARALHAEMSRRYGGTAPVQQPTDPAQPALPPAILEKITGLESTLTALQQERQEQARNATTQNVEAFFSDPKNRYADNVAPLMASLINQAQTNGEKVNLPAIYEQACWLHPEVRDLLINEKLAASTPAVSNPAKAQVAADQARQAAKAVTGAPSRGVPPSNAPPANETIRATILRAVEEQKGR